MPQADQKAVLTQARRDTRRRLQTMLADYDPDTEAVVVTITLERVHLLHINLAGRMFAETISQYQGLPRQEAFDIEYWLLEEAKLQRMPPEKELARHVVVVIGAGSSMFPRERVISSLVKYDIPFDENEETEHLRDKLANFYAQRTLTRSPITLTDQAEAAYLLTSSKLSKTTGQIVSVDGGLHEAFLR